MRDVVLVAVILAACAGACVPAESIETLPPQRPPVTYRTSKAEPSVEKPPPTPRRSYRSPACKPAIETGPRSWMPTCQRISPRWTTIVIHHSATKHGSASTFDRYHRQHNGWDELGYHFVIGNGTDTPDGHVEVGPRWNKQKHGAHCKTPSNYFNEHGIGICLVGDFDKTRPTSRQLASLNRLVKYLCAACRIPVSRVTTHGGVTHKTRCPGRNFDIAAVRRAITVPVTASVHR